MVLETDVLVVQCRDSGPDLARIGLKAGLQSQWLYRGLEDACFVVELLETGRVRTAFKDARVPLQPKQNGRHERMHLT